MGACEGLALSRAREHILMNDDAWRRVRALFERAVDENPADVLAWLDREGVVDGHAREEVLSLLKHHAAAGSFLAEPAGDQLPAFIGDDHPLNEGDALGSYTIIRELGRGGMGRVYLARDGRLGRMVALKALSADLTGNPAHRERLRREARAAAALSHPHICAIYALEEIDGELYIAAEVVNGHTLRTEIAGGRRPTPEEVVRTAQELADGLAHAHSRGVT